jgi:GT2 family glycosyltransferase
MIAGERVESFRTEVGRAGVNGEVVIVDHSESPAELERLQGLAADRLLARPNRGFAAGMNAGIAASSGKVILAGNSDIVFHPGAVVALLEALAAGWTIAAPQFVLGRWLLPPAEVHSLGHELARTLASHSRRAWCWHFGRELRRWRRGWESSEPIPCAAHPGALLAFSRASWERLGPWDERYFLYFEETDWLRRAVRRGAVVALVPQARVTHRWAQSADPVRENSHFLASRRRFYLTHFPLTGRLALWLSSRIGPALQHPPLPPDLRLPQEKVLWLFSPNSSGFPSAALLGGGRPPLAALAELEVQRGRHWPVNLFATDPASGRVLGVWHWDSAADRT